MKSKDQLLLEEAYDKISGEWKQYDSLAVGDFVKYYDPSQGDIAFYRKSGKILAIKGDTAIVHGPQGKEKVPVKEIYWKKH